MKANERPDGSTGKTEIIAFSSGKGGTGKTLIATCLGYALTKIGLRVLIIDSDTATDGISLYLLGPDGVDKVHDFPSTSTLSGILRQSREQGDLQFKPWKINRSMPSDHGVIYEAIISGRQIYGDRFETSAGSGIQLDREAYRKVIQEMFDSLRAGAEFDYVIVDTRGGFSNESTDVSALADSYIVVTEADVTSFYQNRNLIHYIDQAASDFGKKAVLRSIIVNKSTQFTSSTNDFELDNLESSFRLQLEKEFPIDYKATHPFPLSFEALTVQKSHRIPIRHALDSDFSYAFLVAFHKILSVVTQPWTKEQVAEWNFLVESVNLAIQKKNEELQKAELEEQEQHKELEKLRKENSEYVHRISSLEREIKEIDERYKREIQRIESFSSKLETGNKAPPPLSPLPKNRNSRRNLAPAIIGVVIFGLIASLWIIRPSAIFASANPTITSTASALEPTSTAILVSMETASSQPEFTQTISPTDTPVIIETPTSTPVQCPQSQFDPLRVIFPLAANFVADLTVPDGSVFSANQEFTKTWFIQNIGGLAWDAKYSIVFFAGEAMGAQQPVPFPEQEIQPGQCAEISIKMTAPGTPGEYRGFWKLREPNNVTRFGLVDNNSTRNDLPLSVVIVVSGEAATPSQ